MNEDTKEKYRKLNKNAKIIMFFLRKLKCKKTKVQNKLQNKKEMKELQNIIQRKKKRRNKNKEKK